MSNKITPWYEVYVELANSLVVFYERNKDQPAKTLFDVCIGNPVFISANQWILNKESSGGLDPIQVFASISSLTLGDDLRMDRIDALFDVLGKTRNYEKIDFSGCPTPVAVRLLSFRERIAQNEIWDAFAAVMNQGKDGFGKDIFTKVRTWSGIGMASFTMFLFWIQPRNFLPLDKNTMAVIRANRADLDPLNTYDDYKELLTKKDTDDYLEMARFVRLTPDAQRKDVKRSAIVSEIVGKGHINIPGGGLRILGIRSLEGCEGDILGPLKPGQLYSLFEAYTISDSGSQIRYYPEKDHGLYNSENLRIDINAIVGKNGTGKSSLAELLLAIMYNIACSYRDAGMLTDGEYLLEAKSDLHAEIYLKTEKIYRITVNGENITYVSYRSSESIFEAQRPQDISSLPLSALYYTFLVNYSLHALNERNIGSWIKPLFHKNDGYQIPATIDPYREEGTIQINRLEELTKDRLLVNLLEPVLDKQADNHRQLTDYQQAVGLILKLNDKKASSIFMGGKERPIDQFNDYEKSLLLFLASFDLKPDIAGEIKAQTLTGKILVYIFRKLISIAETYGAYRKFLKENGLEDEAQYFLDLHRDTSHITYKLRQAVNYLRYDHLPRTTPILITLDDLSTEIARVKLNNSSLETMELIPPSCFDVEIQMADRKQPKRISPFGKLSSGEKQLIFTVNAITYHLRNLDSVHNGQRSLVKYEYVNVVMDEIELYFHPELQRQFLDRLRRQVEILELPNIKAINFVFITHSPFILSDIPKGNTLFLDRPDCGAATPLDAKNKKNTLGANIHELLAGGFFMNDTIGVFAVRKIKEVIDFCRSVQQAGEESRDDLKGAYELRKQEFYFIRDNIGENYLQAIVEENILDIERKFETKEYINWRVQQLQQEIKNLDPNA
ncbi:AAA family ATPase [Flavitalea sp. BT771]|uniref:AAA family ATPase n=1 Tax=Flavitalea sp. BT771 TaxID=3063329 RepID=UPI0026E380EC|nr:AAA family ATPase [Flavitalea sp. BT771]MDO6434803.1 AAA family ATPase [Flavitalea sp. BT771]MDV6223703.1 AAA family ATPase [Flavitalea sp. BT771]